LLVCADAQLARHARWRRALMALLALAGVLAYFPALRGQGGAFFHDWEMFHYVLGSKYAPELGYERLYVCTAVADAENGHADEVRARTLRDLRDDGVITGAEALSAPKACTDHFAPRRWREFRQDVSLFRQVAGSDARWAQMQLDHGYNPSPVWTLLGRALASAAPLTVSVLKRLAWIDPLLMAAGLGLLWLGFGARAAWLGCVFWSTQSASSFGWTGGAFLRQDWLLLAIAAVVLMRKRRMFASGACLTWSAALRVFPVLFFAGPALLAFEALRRRRDLTVRLWLGAACAVFVLGSATLLAGSSAQTYREFARHLTMHARTPIANHMSLRAVVSFDPRERFAQLARSGDPELQTWPAARQQRLARRWSLHYALIAAYLLGFWHCVRRIKTPWIALGLSFPLIMALTDPSTYYYSMVVLTVPLARARRSVEILLLGLAASSQLIMLDLKLMDDRYVALSALYLAFGAALLVLFSRPLRAR
jgi:hypothetical protein